MMIFLLFIEYYTSLPFDRRTAYVAYHSVSSHFQLFLSNCVTFFGAFFRPKKNAWIQKTQSESLELEAKSSKSSS